MVSRFPPLGRAARLTNTPALLIAGLIATGGPIIALVLGVHRRLGIGALSARQATLAGIGSGVVAMGVAYGLEHVLTPVLGGETGKPSEGLYLLAGPIEEGAKLLVPIILLAAGAAFIRAPRLGVWAVLLRADCSVPSRALFTAPTSEELGPATPARSSLRH